MQKIIEGKVYDTKTATLVASTSTHSRVLTLYRTQKSAWFTHENNDRAGLSKIKLRTPEEAMTLLVKWDNVAAMKKYFPDKIEEG